MKCAACGSTLIDRVNALLKIDGSLQYSFICSRGQQCIARVECRYSTFVKAPAGNSTVERYHLPFQIGDAWYIMRGGYTETIRGLVRFSSATYTEISHLAVDADRRDYGRNIANIPLVSLPNNDQFDVEVERLKTRFAKLLIVQ